MQLLHEHKSLASGIYTDSFYPMVNLEIKEAQEHFFTAVKHYF